MLRRMLVVLTLLATAACGGGTDEETPGAQDSPTPKPSFAAGTSMAAIQQAGKLRVGVKFDVPQFGFLNPTTNKPEGFDVDMGNAIADALSVEAEFSEAVSANRIPFLREDKVDLVFSTMTITEERRKEIDFTDVYYVAGQAFLTKKGEDMTVEKAAGKNVCTAKGSTSEQNLPKLQPKVEIQLQTGYAQCFQLLQNGQTDAVTTDDVILLGFLKQAPAEFELSDQRFSQEPYGGGIKKGRSDLLVFVNDIIREMKKDGRWADIYEKWVTPITGTDAPTPPAIDVKFEVGTGTGSGSASPTPTR